MGGRETLKARVIVRLKPGVRDPQGETIRSGLETLGHHDLVEVRQGKYFELLLDTDTRETAEALAHRIADTVLANPVLETFEVELLD